MRVCNDPTCAEVIDAAWCAAHKPKHAPQRRDRTRTKYSGNWSTISRRFRRRYPDCQCVDPECRCRGTCTSASAEVDHIVPVVYWPSPDDANDLSNLAALCKPCHSSKTRRKDSQRPTSDPTEPR